MQAQQLWQAVLGDMEVRLTKNAFDHWLRHTSIVGFQDDVATVAAANAFSASTLQARYAGQIERAVSDIVGRPIRVQFTVRGAAAPDPIDADEEDQAETDSSPQARETAALLAAGARSLFGDQTPAPAEPRGHGRPPAPRSRSAPVTVRRDEGVAATVRRAPGPSKQLALAAAPTHGLNPRYVYESYVVGSSNRFAHAASLSVAEHPGGKFNPFFVHGGVGLGKTHLLHAVGHRALEIDPDLTIAYVSSEKFTNDLINAIRAQRMEEFRARYRTIDILMIDDIQFIAGKESTQEEFFHTFNALYQSGKQVIITSDKPPKSISALEDRLRSRFEGGLIADVQFPDYEMRTAILRTKGEELGAAVPADVVEYVAQKDQTNIRELEGALNKILALSQITDRPLTLQLAMEALTDAAIGARRAKTTPAGVVDAVAAYYGVALKDLKGRGRTKEIVLPRQVAMYLVREETGASLVDIGRELGDRDHTTVMHGIEKIERELTTDTTLRSQLMAIREALFSQSGA
ncbi:MAG: chromosomal replication initiator protein DnaA [Chloroflexota bacterium]|nr:chromosomal replication initiator protein DnaA [Chloroflexota bacterium]